ncbi:hypothetical protein CW304_27705 [Bacillus sp. UFRGS-B20]|nr:hypothetical protein CW304_27705 [Bacillus sp. UFRGS-B20]
MVSQNIEKGENKRKEDKKPKLAKVDFQPIFQLMRRMKRARRRRKTVKVNNSFSFTKSETRRARDSEQNEQDNARRQQLARLIQRD